LAKSFGIDGLEIDTEPSFLTRSLAVECEIILTGFPACSSDFSFDTTLVSAGTFSNAGALPSTFVF